MSGSFLQSHSAAPQSERAQASHNMVAGGDKVLIACEEDISRHRVYDCVSEVERLFPCQVPYIVFWIKAQAKITQLGALSSWCSDLETQIPGVVVAKEWEQP